MKKIRTILLTVCICLLLPVTALAAQSEIGATVPEYHSVSIEAEHASALYVQGSKGESRAYSVPRFSEPEFQIRAEDGWSIERVLLNDIDVSSQVKDGILKLTQIREDQVITIETTQKQTGGGGTKQENTGTQPTGAGNGNGKVDSSGEGNKTVIGTLVAVATGDRSVTVIAALALGGGVLMLWGAWRRRKKTIL